MIEALHENNICLDCVLAGDNRPIQFTPPINRINLEWNNCRSVAQNCNTSLENLAAWILGLIWNRTTSNNNWTAMISRSIWPAANRWRNATQSSKWLCYFKCSATDGSSARMGLMCLDQPTGLAYRKHHHHTSYYILSFDFRRSEGLAQKDFLWTHFAGIFLLTLKRIGLAFTLEDVGIFSFQLYSSRVIVFISQHRLLSHTVIRPVESVIGQSNDTVLSGCSIITCRMTSNAVPTTSCQSRNIYIGFLTTKDTNITMWYSTQSYMAISWSVMVVLTHYYIE